MLPGGQSVGRPLHGRIVAKRPADTICCGSLYPPNVGLGLPKCHITMPGKQLFPAKMTSRKSRIPHPGVVGYTSPSTFP